MTVGSSKFDASPSALGYLNQLRSALLIALQRDDEPYLCLSVEKLDDVAFHEANNSPNVATELRQYKLHVERQGGLGDKSPDIWKTLRVWAEAATTGQIDLDRVKLCLVTTSAVTDQNAVRLLHPDPSKREPETARESLEKAGSESKNEVVREAYSALSKLTVPERKKLFSAMYLFSGSIDATSVQGQIGRCLWSACVSQHRDAFINRLEGWWIDLVVRHLSQGDPALIPIYLVQQQVDEIRSQFGRDRLPDDLLHESIPEDVIDTTEESVFVRQLTLIRISAARLRLAQEDHYRAFAQRSRWVKDKLVGLDEMVRYETRLVTCWKERFLIMVEGVQAACDEPTLAHHGSELLNWIVAEAPSRSHLWIRLDFQSEYMTKGSYHMLADQLRVGWHPEYQARLAPPATPPVPPASKLPRKRKGISK